MFLVSRSMSLLRCQWYPDVACWRCHRRAAKRGPARLNISFWIGGRRFDVGLLEVVCPLRSGEMGVLSNIWLFRRVCVLCEHKPSDATFRGLLVIRQSESVVTLRGVSCGSLGFWFCCSPVGEAVGVVSTPSSSLSGRRICCWPGRFHSLNTSGNLKTLGRKTCPNSSFTE